MDLEESLNIRPATNPIAKPNGGNLIEWARGITEVAEFAHQQEQITSHTLMPGQIGGNHYHETKKETIYVFSGALTISLKDIKTKEKCTTTIRQGYKFDIQPGIAHAIQNLTRESVVFLETASLAFNPNNPRKDVFPYQIL